jgi:3-oxoadipate enol-lactonase
MRWKDSPAERRAATGLPELGERYADVKGVRMRYFVREGDGEALVLVHGLGGSASNWRELVGHLDARTRLLVPELPGHAGSSPLPAAPNLGAFADRLAILARREGFTPAVFVGHSLGGLVALRLAIRSPADVRGVVLGGSAGVSSTGSRARKGLAVVALVKPGRRLAPFRRTIAQSALLRRAVLAWGASDPAAMSPAAAESFLSSPAIYTDTVSAMRALVADDVRRELAAVPCPCLVLWGAGDAQTAIADAFDFARRLRAPLRVIADCGHLLVGERPDAAGHAIAEFLGSRALRPGSARR